MIWIDPNKGLRNIKIKSCRLHNFLKRKFLDQLLFLIISIFYKKLKNKLLSQQMISNHLISQQIIIFLHFLKYETLIHNDPQNTPSKEFRKSYVLYKFRTLVNKVIKNNREEINRNILIKRIKIYLKKIKNFLLQKYAIYLYHQ
jgi:hypothetical protein